MRWQHCLDHADNIQKPADSPDRLLGVVTQPTDSRLKETMQEHDYVEIKGGIYPGTYCMFTKQLS